MRQHWALTRCWDLPKLLSSTMEDYMTAGHAGQLTTSWIIVLVAEYGLLRGWVGHRVGTIIEWGEDND